MPDTTSFMILSVFFIAGVTTVLVLEEFVGLGWPASIVFGVPGSFVALLGFAKVVEKINNR